MFSTLFKSLVQARNAAYTLGLFKSRRLDAPVISVGNITVGGTGKTPVVAHLAKELLEDGEKVCILTRGYGRKSPTKRIVVSDGGSILASAEDAGDEPRELAERLGGKAVIIADPDRVSAGIFATDAFKPTVFLLDDGFQHRKIFRDFDIVCVDATNPFGNGKTLPFGILREPPGNLRRAHTIVITRGNLVTADKLSKLKERISREAPDAELVVTNLEFVDIRELKGEGRLDRDLRALAFCGLGNPDNFYGLLRQDGFNIVGTHSFKDHHRYSQNDIDNLTVIAKDLDAEALVTTEKDAVKLSSLKVGVPCFAASVQIGFPPNEKLGLSRGAAAKR